MRSPDSPPFGSRALPPPPALLSAHPIAPPAAAPSPTARPAAASCRLPPAAPLPLAPPSAAAPDAVPPLRPRMAATTPPSTTSAMASPVAAFSRPRARSPRMRRVAADAALVIDTSCRRAPVVPAAPVARRPPSPPGARRASARSSAALPSATTMAAPTRGQMMAMAAMAAMAGHPEIDADDDDDDDMSSMILPPSIVAPDDRPLDGRPSLASRRMAAAAAAAADSGRGLHGADGAASSLGRLPFARSRIPWAGMAVTPVPSAAGVASPCGPALATMHVAAVPGAGWGALLSGGTGLPGAQSLTASIQMPSPVAASSDVGFGAAAATPMAPATAAAAAAAAGVDMSSRTGVPAPPAMAHPWPTAGRGIPPPLAWPARPPPSAAPAPPPALAMPGCYSASSVSSAMASHAMASPAARQPTGGARPAAPWTAAADRAASAAGGRRQAHHFRVPPITADAGLDGGASAAPFMSPSGAGLAGLVGLSSGSATIVQPPLATPADGATTIAVPLPALPQHAASWSSSRRGPDATAHDAGADGADGAHDGDAAADAAADIESMPLACGALDHDAINRIVIMCATVAVFSVMFGVVVVLVTSMAAAKLTDQMHAEAVAAAGGSRASVTYITHIVTSATDWHWVADPSRAVVAELSDQLVGAGFRGLSG